MGNTLFLLYTILFLYIQHVMFWIRVNVGKGMIRAVKEVYPDANIVPIDYDPGATKVNQENRIKLMLAVAKERV